jgi:hypothetical protein
MRQKSPTRETTSEQVVKDIGRATRKHHSAEEKIRIVLDGLRGEYSIAELLLNRGLLRPLADVRGFHALHSGRCLLSNPLQRWRGIKVRSHFDPERTNSLGILSPEVLSRLGV